MAVLKVLSSCLGKVFYKFVIKIQRTNGAGWLGIVLLTFDQWNAPENM